MNALRGSKSWPGRHPTPDGCTTPAPDWFTAPVTSCLCTDLLLQDPSFSSSMRSGCVATNQAKSTTCYTYADGGPKSSGGDLVLHASRFQCACVADTTRAGYTGCAKCVTPAADAAAVQSRPCCRTTGPTRCWLTGMQCHALCCCRPDARAANRALPSKSGWRKIAQLVHHETMMTAPPT